jgi:hypothetical protein
VADNFTTLWRRLQLRAPSLGAPFAQDIIRDAFNQLAERREWSWAIGYSSFYPPTYPSPGTTTVTALGGTLVVTSSAAYFTTDMVGKQIRIGQVTSTAYPTYTILSYLGPTQVGIDKPWTGPDAVGLTFLVFQCYYPVPQDFQYFISMVNTTSNYRVWTDITQTLLDTYDPQRTNYGNSYATAYYDDTPSYSGVVGPVVQIIGSGPAPISTTSVGYTYPQSSVYTVEIITGGTIGTATFQWKQDSAAFSPVTTTPDDESAYFLSNGVAVYFPAGTYVAGDLFVIQCSAVEVKGVPRYELWPRPIQTPYIYPFRYRKVPPPLTDDQPSLPSLIANRGDVILEMALARCAMWPGTDTTRNPYYDLNLARMHEIKAETMINELEMKDDDTGVTNICYEDVDFYPAPWMDGKWLQRHAIYGS